MFFSLGSATKPDDAARSMNNSRIIIWIGENGIGTPKSTGRRKISISAVLTDR